LAGRRVSRGSASSMVCAHTYQRARCLPTCPGASGRWGHKLPDIPIPALTAGGWSLATWKGNSTPGNLITQ
jgi:hypothetical protein